MFSIERLWSFPDNELKSHVQLLETFLKHDDSYDLDGDILFEELKVVREVLTAESKWSYMILNSLKTFNYFPDATITWKIFSKLKLLKYYLHSTMSQNRLNSLGLISFENSFLKNLVTLIMNKSLMIMQQKTQREWYSSSQ